MFNTPTPIQLTHFQVYQHDPEVVFPQLQVLRLTISSAKSFLSLFSIKSEISAPIMFLTNSPRKLYKLTSIITSSYNFVIASFIMTLLWLQMG